MTLTSTTTTSTPSMNNCHPPSILGNNNVINNANNASLTSLVRSSDDDLGSSSLVNNDNKTSSFSSLVVESTTAGQSMVNGVKDGMQEYEDNRMINNRNHSDEEDVVVEDVSSSMMNNNSTMILLQQNNNLTNLLFNNTLMSNINNNLVNNNTLVNNSIMMDDLDSSSVSSSSSFKSIDTSVTAVNGDSMIYSTTCHARAILTCCSNSHPFEERVLDLSNPVKIGRAVARAKPSANNGIFDCKVLSRNHAVLWFDDDSQRFLIQDTKSSNGTFVNKNRLSNTNTESTPSELSSGDVIQFGVDVVENTKRVTHGCVVASIRLYLPTGQEQLVMTSTSDNVNEDNNGRCSPSLGINNPTSLTISHSQLIQVTQCLKEALIREEFLTKKMSCIESVINSLSGKSRAAWTSLVEEDRLLSRIESLQQKLQSLVMMMNASKTDDEVTFLRNQVLRLHDERDAYESTAKESILSSKEKESRAVSLTHELDIQVKASKVEIERLLSCIEDYESSIARLQDSMEVKDKELQEALRENSENRDVIKKLKENEKRFLDSQVTVTSVVNDRENSKEDEGDSRSNKEKKLVVVKQEQGFSGRLSHGSDDSESTTDHRQQQPSLDEESSVKKTMEDKMSGDQHHYITDTVVVKEEEKKMQEKVESGKRELTCRETAAQNESSTVDLLVKKESLVVMNSSSSNDTPSSSKSENEDKQEHDLQSSSSSSQEHEVLKEKESLKSLLEDKCHEISILKQEVTQLRQRRQRMKKEEDQDASCQTSIDLLEITNLTSDEKSGQVLQSNEHRTVSASVICFIDVLLTNSITQITSNTRDNEEEKNVNQLKRDLDEMSESKSLLEETVSLLNEELEVVKYQTKIVSVMLLLLYRLLTNALSSCCAIITGINMCHYSSPTPSHCHFDGFLSNRFFCHWNPWLMTS